MTSDDNHTLPTPTRDLALAKTQLDRFGYCLLEQALDDAQLARVRTRLDEQAIAERQADVGYFDGAPDQNWGSFRDANGKLREDAFSAATGINQRVWMLPNKGQVFLDLLSHTALRELVDHILGEHYLLSSYSANIANPGGVAMPLHTDQWWMPAATRRGRTNLRAGSIRRDRFDDDLHDGQPPLVASAACCNIMWILDDFSEQNGATRIVPGSHMLGFQPQQSGSDIDHDNTAIAATAPAGCAVVFDGRLWHGTGANCSNAARRGLLTTFCGPQFRPQENYTVGTLPEVLQQLSSSPDLLQLLGFRVWCGYGRTGSPLIDLIDREQPGIGEMRPV